MKITDTQSFGKALRDKRKEKGYKQSDIASFTGYSVSFISDLENGKATCELGKAIYLANMLGMDLLLESRK